MSTAKATSLIQGSLLTGAVLCGVVGLGSLIRLAQVNPGWMLIGLAAIFTAILLYSRNYFDFIEEIATAKQSQVDRLLAEIDQRRRAVDSLADGLDVAVFICDSRAQIRYANQRARELFRFEDPRGQNLLGVTLSYDLEQVALRAARDKVPQDAEITFTYPDERTGLAKAWPAQETQGNVFVSVYEITDLRRLERIRQDFVANVSHELRTPMTLIRTMAETLLDESDPNDELSQRYLSKIMAEVDRLSGITQDLLILSTAESNPVRKHICDIAELFREVVGQLHGRADAKGLEIGYEGVPSLKIHANAAQMTQVALNLVENAINYTAEGSITVKIQHDGNFVMIQVSDTGIGISSEHLKRIFERFYRVDKGRSRGSGGTGLGLSIVKHIIEAHGGAVTVESELNIGSTFTARLPIDDIPPTSNFIGPMS